MANNEIRFTTHLTATIAEIEAKAQQNLLAAAIVWHNGVIKLLRGGRSGRIYPIPGNENGRTYQASPPGEAPAVRLGDLRTSYRYLVKGNKALIGSPLHYALTLEKGSSRVAPRPHLLPAYTQNRQKILNALRSNWV